MHVMIIGGFLGSGKTTLLPNMVKRKAAGSNEIELK